MRFVRFSDVIAWIKENDLWVVLFLALVAWRIYNWSHSGKGLVGVIFIVLGAIFGGLMYFKLNIYKLMTREAGALVCSLGDNPALVETVEGDAEVYRGHFPTVEVLKAPKLADLLATISAGDFRILHLLGEFSEDGMLVEVEGRRVEVTSLFELCRAKKYLFVYFGWSMPEKNRAVVFRRAVATRVRHDFPLVITTDRGAEFSSFLDKLLREIGKGTMPGSAWLGLRPQDASPGAPQPAVDPGPKALLYL